MPDALPTQRPVTPPAPTNTQAMPATGIAGAIPAAAHTLDGRHGLLGITIVRELPSHRVARRFLARRTEDNAPLMLYRIGPWTTLADPASFVDRTFELRHLRAENICCIKDAAVANDRGCWLVGGYPGHAAGVTTLREAVNAREGGRLGRHETRTVIEQVLSASAAAHRVGIVHGPIALDDLLLTPKGRVVIELYGLEASLRPGLDKRAARENITEEVRSIARLAFQLLTGGQWATEADPTPKAGRHRLARTVPCHRWRAWLALALWGEHAGPSTTGPRNAAESSPGFASADEALSALRTLVGKTPQTSGTAMARDWKRRASILRRRVVRTTIRTAEHSTGPLRRAWTSRLR